MAVSKTKKSTGTTKKATTSKAKTSTANDTNEPVIKQEEAEDKSENVIRQKLKALYSLQVIDTQIDKIRVVRGELPLEVRDLEDEIEGLDTRIENFKAEITDFESQLNDQKNAINQSLEMIKKYDTQQQNVRNNREYESLTKEIEYQNLEIQLCEKKIKEAKAGIEAKQSIIIEATAQLNEKKENLEAKKSELAEIIEETEKEEQVLSERSEESKEQIEERLLYAYTRIRKNVRNGLAVVKVERDACGGCFSKIPPQRQLEIKLNKKIIVCEYCGRILVDNEIADEVESEI